MYIHGAFAVAASQPGAIVTVGAALTTVAASEPWPQGPDSERDGKTFLQAVPKPHYETGALAAEAGSRDCAD